MYNPDNSHSPFDNYTKYKSPDPILLLSDNIKPKYVPYFNIDDSSFFNLSNYDDKGIPNAAIIIILLLCIIGIMYDFLFSI